MFCFLLAIFVVAAVSLYVRQMETGKARPCCLASLVQSNAKHVAAEVYLHSLKRMKALRTVSHTLSRMSIMSRTDAFQQKQITGGCG